ncbi:uncharacterized protein LOC114874721 isoform X1 [Osmia bicornis bicornis]|uniref:uncharacterized protein LOC114874721 isoform X1 n=2 Tax=Osmia bicornis bicornis TaxID=1437191 RepID=UPI001EAEB58F|nr:uncharacterized protein LOC114874721 isoform X1 [Osmia bicornis bicornis]
MNNTEELMSDIYNTLVKIRYPKITTTVAQNVYSMILSGESRISLLSWILTEKSPEIAIKLQKLKGDILEAELFKCYSEIGICTDKNLLLGNCKLEDELSTLRLLLDFIKCMFIESPDIEYEEKESIDDILNVYINEDLSALTSIVKSKLSYSEALEYFDNLQKQLDESSSCKLEKEHLEEHPTEIKREENNEEEQTSIFNTEKENFIEAFSNIGSWPMLKTKSTRSNLYSMDADIENIYSNFSSLTQFLQAKEEICNASIPKEISKINTSLSEIVEETAIATEEILNVTNNY